MRLNITPTRMELMRLKTRLGTAERGHKLLKDKQNELVRQFLQLVRKNKTMRQQMETELQQAMKEYVIASATTSNTVLEEAFAIPFNTVAVDIQQQKIMNVQTPIINRVDEDELIENTFSYGLVSTNNELDIAVHNLAAVLPLMLELAAIEKTCQLLAAEIETTRRRVNALEYMTIPQLKETIEYIEMKLAENERDVIIRMLKIKDIVAKTNKGETENEKKAEQN